MKKTIYLLLTIFIVGFIYSCKDMDETYKEFLVPNGLTYPQKPDSLKVHAGYNKLRLTWLKANDPSVLRSEIYWNNYLDTLKVDIPQNKDTVVVDVDNLNEGTYTFYVKTFDIYDNASIPSEVTGTSYGDNYVMAATDRTIASAIRDGDRKGTITWNGKTSDLAYSEVRYKTSSGQTKVVRVLPEENSLICPDVKPGELFEYRSVFLPPKGIDYVPREWNTYETPFMYKYPRNTWTAEARNGNHDWGDGGGGQPALLFDGKMSTGWHSKVGAALPQCVVVDMKEPLMVDNIILYPPTQTNWRYMKNIEIYVSDTPIKPDVPQPSWGKPVAKVLYEGGDKIPINLDAAVQSRYIAVVFLDTSNANPYISFMEFEVYGY